MFEISDSSMLTAHVHHFAFTLCFILCSSEELNITLPQLRTRTQLGNYSQQLYVFIAHSCTVEITSKFNLLSYTQHHITIYLYTLLVNFLLYCMLCFLRLIFIIIKVTGDTLDKWICHANLSATYDGCHLKVTYTSRCYSWHCKVLFSLPDIK